MRKQVVVTSVFGSDAEKLGRTFTSFASRTDAVLHAFVLGEELPKRRENCVSYHLVAPDHTFGHPYREACYRRWEYIDELEADYALVVDGTDVLCMQDLPPFFDLIRGGSLAACVEQHGGRYIDGQGYTSAYLNGGVTLWNIETSKELRSEICARGRKRCRTIVGDNQMSLNDVVHTRYYKNTVILPSQFNYRAFLNRRKKGWPTVDHLDGVMIYHNGTCIEDAKELMPVAPLACLPPLEYRPPPTGYFDQLLVRIRNRLNWHVVK